MTTSTILVLAGIALLVLAAFAAAYAYRVFRETRMRNAIVALISKKESIAASAVAVGRLAKRLADSSDADLHRFATDPVCEERHAFADIAVRMRITADEIQFLDAPKDLDSMRSQMETAARYVAYEATLASGAGGEDALAGAASMDLATMAELVSQMSDRLHRIAESFDVDDPSVYGGGLYI
jgi:hypothetical protein